MPDPQKASPSVEPIISVRGLHRYFGEKHVLRGADLDIYPGETICMLGTSGGGKSVMVKHMLGLMQPDEGSVIIDGTEISQMSERKLGPVRKKVGMMFQNGALFDSMNVAQNIAFPLREGGIKDLDTLNRRIAEVLEIVRLPGQEETMPSDLSGGMRKRVALARAIVDHPACVCYDEPHAGLDPVTADSIDHLIKRLQNEHGITNIVITHELRSVFRIADRIAFMKDGQVYWQGTPKEMKSSDDPVLMQFLSGVDSSGEKWASGDSD
ncbi:ATP-binding cassette domain-containing protein [Verrucomicrobiaceae bacterium 5K15]|uniref:ATP-binding cassette domain-containing protein n=1 Tax=Oceaniferula flava TaxID=2800421 RepID=A0AAE2VCS9_9BACT|nr:ATP-binding cassette domain-containing protein [Oceaniferula flavus]MBK1855446.1 ATP-binding cassette domain-containing protein [Oceaniferula flavus]MBM1136752.1 ATP-binding cassette domain-containing protein [Oceaniferula flavus]